MAIPTIEELAQELVTLCKTAPIVGDKGYSVFGVADLENFAGIVGYPLAGVSYEGCRKIENAVDTSTGREKVSAASMFNLNFMIIGGITYTYGSARADTKPIITDLLDELRPIVLGYKGVNTRPWKFVGETPLESELEGVIFYGQMWETIIPVIGNNPT